MEIKPKKKFYKRWWFWVIVVVVVFGALGSGGSDDNKTTKDTSSKPAVEQNKNELTSSDKELLKKHYKDFNVDERTQFAEIEDKYKKINDNEKQQIKSDFERLSKERDIQVAEWAKQEEAAKKAKAAEEAKKQEEFIKKNTKKLPAGEHIVGTHLDAGSYEVTFNGSGNFIAYASDGSPLINEIGGSDLGVSKYRAILPQGAKIQISGMSINVKPIKSTLMNYGEVNLYAGYWIVGQDVTAGRYKAAATNGSGNFFVYGSGGTVKTNEILGGEIGTPEVVINLEDGDIINIASLKNVKLVPEK